MQSLTGLFCLVFSFLGLSCRCKNGSVEFHFDLQPFYKIIFLSLQSLRI